jgi:sigma-E factor negative regulatory protein RseB
MRFAPFICGISGLLLIAQSAQAADTVDWLDKLSASNKVSSYGAFIYESSGYLTSHQIARQVNRQGDVQEHLYRLDGSPYEVMRENGRVTCSSSAEEDQPGVPKSISLGFKPNQIEKGYTVKYLGESRIADNATDIVAFMPKDPYRYAYEIQLEKAKGQILKSTMYDHKGSVLERLQYITYSLVSPNASELAPKAKCFPVAKTQDSGQLEKSSWAASWLPAGFELVRSFKSWFPSSDGRPVQYLLYSDGLSTFSVFVDSEVQAGVADSRNQYGPTSVVSKRINPSDKDVLITVVGEIPMGAAERIALSVRPD